MCKYLSIVNKHDLFCHTVAPTSLIKPDKPTLVCDSGASYNFIKQADTSLLEHKKELKNGPPAQLPNGTAITPTQDGFLPISSLSAKAKHSLVYPGIQNASLLSIGQMCDDGCIAIFDANNMSIIKNDEIILTG